MIVSHGSAAEAFVLIAKTLALVAEVAISAAKAVEAASAADTEAQVCCPGLVPVLRETQVLIETLGHPGIGRLGLALHNVTINCEIP